MTTTIKNLFACAWCGKRQNRKTEGSILYLPAGSFTLDEAYKVGTEFCTGRCLAAWRGER